VVPLVKVLLAPREMVLTSLADHHVVSCDIHASGRRWRSCSTSTTCARCRWWTRKKKLAGVIYAEQVIAQLRDELSRG
jgi:magnesium transporter